MKSCNSSLLRSRTSFGFSEYFQPSMSASSPHASSVSERPASGSWMMLAYVRRKSSLDKYVTGVLPGPLVRSLVMPVRRKRKKRVVLRASLHAAIDQLYERMDSLRSIVRAAVGGKRYAEIVASLGRDPFSWPKQVFHRSFREDGKAKERDSVDPPLDVAPSPRGGDE